MNQFADKVCSMTGAEIVYLMVEALKDPVYPIDMQTFGERIDGVCYGCAATNLIARLSGTKVEFDATTVSSFQWASVLNETEAFIAVFENAIDALRRGEIQEYNAIAREVGLTQLPYPPNELPELDDGYTEGELMTYERYADWVKELENPNVQD